MGLACAARAAPSSGHVSGSRGRGGGGDGDGGGGGGGAAAGIALAEGGALVAAENGSRIKRGGGLEGVLATDGAKEGRGCRSQRCTRGRKTLQLSSAARNVDRNVVADEGGSMVGVFSVVDGARIPLRIKKNGGMFYGAQGMQKKRRTFARHFFSLSLARVLTCCTISAQRNERGFSAFAARGTAATASSQRFFSAVMQ